MEPERMRHGPLPLASLMGPSLVIWLKRESVTT